MYLASSRFALISVLFSSCQCSHKEENIEDCLNLLCSDLRHLSEVEGKYSVVSSPFSQLSVIGTDLVSLDF